MSQQNFTDPRDGVSFDIEPGMVFRDTRESEPRLVVEYATRDGGVVYVDTDGDARRSEIYKYDSYDTFESNVGAGRFKPVRNDAGNIVREGRIGQIHRLMEQYEKQSGRTATHKAEAIQEVLDIITDDVPEDHNDTVPLEDIDGIGSKAAETLRRNGLTTKGDVRNVSSEQIQELPYMGAKNTDRLKEYVE